MCLVPLQLQICSWVAKRRKSAAVPMAAGSAGGGSASGGQQMVPACSLLITHVDYTHAAGALPRACSPVIASHFHRSGAALTDCTSRRRSQYRDSRCVCRWCTSIMGSQHRLINPPNFCAHGRDLLANRFINISNKHNVLMKCDHAANQRCDHATHRRL